jgi:hypothetical protein
MIQWDIFLAPKKPIFASERSTFPFLLLFFLLGLEDEDVGDHTKGEVIFLDIYTGFLYGI